MDLQNGDKLNLLNGETITVKSKLGEGGQGAVYLVSLSGKDYALKWYLPNYLKGLKPNHKKFYQNLLNNVNLGSPSPAFLWQQAVAVTGKKSEGFGYIMDLRPTQYEEFTKFIKAKVNFKSTEVVIRAGIKVVEAFQMLHRRGLSYQDLSPGNFFINKNTGDVLVCDNDNVAPNGENLGVGGTPGYMAPEVVLGKDKPNTNTDLFSLAVILFELFFMSHPLDGANCCKYPCLTQQVEKDLYAINPVFVMDPKGTNPPVRGVHSNLIRLWPVYPDFLREAFQKAFGEGMKDANKRLTERDWLKVLNGLIADGIPCPKCGELNFASKAKDGVLTCDCGKKYQSTFATSINDFKVYASVDKKITEYHIFSGDQEKVIGTFVESKKNPGIFGLKNDSASIWTVEYPDKPTTTYEPGKVVTMIPGTIITIANKKIEIIK